MEQILPIGPNDKNKFLSYTKFFGNPVKELIFFFIRLQDFFYLNFSVFMGLGPVRRTNKLSEGASRPISYLIRLAMREV